MDNKNSRYLYALVGIAAVGVAYSIKYNWDKLVESVKNNA